MRCCGQPTRGCQLSRDARGARAGMTNGDAWTYIGAGKRTEHESLDSIGSRRERAAFALDVQDQKSRLTRTAGIGEVGSNVEDRRREASFVRAMPIILTSRLKLILLTPGCLRAMLEGDYTKAGALGGFSVTPDCPLLGHSSIQRRLGMIERDPEQHPWMYRGIVRSDDNLMVGHISFHHKAPDPDLFQYSRHAAELGYAISAGQRRKGYARESVLAMMEWARGQKVETFCLSISPRNIPSLKLAESMGFRKVAERIDEIDGLEYVYIADKTDTRQNIRAGRKGGIPD